MHTLDVLPAGIQTAGVAEVRRMAWEEGKGKETVAVAETAVALEWAEAVALAATADYVLEAEIVSVKELAADAVVEQEQVAWQDVVDDPEVQCLVVLQGGTSKYKKQCKTPNTAVRIKQVDNVCPEAKLCHTCPSKFVSK